MSFFRDLHQRTSSLKAQGIPLLSLHEPDPPAHSVSSALDRPSLVPISELETVPLEDSNDFENMGNDRESELPIPVSSMSSATNDDKKDVQHEPLTPRSNMLTQLRGDVDPEAATSSLIAYCFMTGFIDSVTFSAAYVWCGFQTGNGTQLAIAIARLFEGPPGQRDQTFHNADQLALTSLLSFVLGAFIGRIGDKMGCKSRRWLMLGTFIQSLFTMAAAIAIWKSGEGSVADSRGDAIWKTAPAFVCVAFMSMSLGLQGIMAKRVNTQFTTTIVLTTTWCELMTDSNLFRRGYHASRDHKIAAIAILFFGGFVGRCLLFQIGSAGTLGIGTGIRFLIALSWYFVPSKPVKP